MAPKVVIDTGPLVAAVHQDERDHDWAVAVISRAMTPMLTCEAVASETAFLSMRGGGSAVEIIEMISKTCRMAMRVDDEWDAIVALMKKYADVPMSFADACLVRIVELNPGAVLITLDADFKIYRANGRRVIKTLAPWS